MNGEQLFLEKKQIIFVCDTAPFGLRPARFATLYPIMTADGETITVDNETFPNRGRVWWKLREGVNEEYVKPGSIWSGPIVEAMGYEENEDKDRYQASAREVIRGQKDVIELVTVDEDTPSLDYVRRGRTLPFARPVSHLVFLRGYTHILGPLRATWDSEEKQLTFSAEDLQNPRAFLVPADIFASSINQLNLDVPINTYHTHEPYYTLPVSLTRTQWATPETLIKIGKVVDVATDDQVINWAAKLKILNISNAQRSLIKSVLPAIESIENNDEARIEHLRQIANDMSRLEAVGKDIVASLIGAEAFRSFLSEHVDQIADKRIAEEIETRSAEIEAELEDLAKRKKKLAAEIKDFEKGFEGAKVEHQRELNVAEQKMLKEFKKREKELSDKEAAVADKEKLVQEQIEKAIVTFREESGKAVESLLVQMPLLQALGFTGSPIQPTSQVSQGRGKIVSFTAPARQIKNATAAISEEAFLDQIRKVVVNEGFYFNDEDILNFHTCMKTGGITVLAGMSGTGKSSLPRLYAQALGFDREFLNISVRPDWLDDRELVGAYNPIAQCFEPGRVGLVDALIEAELDHKAGGAGIYLFNLDEANLARIEHYFAQFLSVMELPFSRRILNLFPKGAVLVNDPYREYQSIQLHPNTLWTATINVDETVHFLSPKLLDRSQIVSLTGNGLTAARIAKSQKPTPFELVPVPIATYTEWCQKQADSESALAVLMKIHEILKPARLGFEHRSLDRMLTYIDLAKAYMTEDRAIDFQVAQIVFPKLRRTAPMFYKVLEELKKVIIEEKFPRSAQLLNRIADAEHEEEFFQLL